MSKQGEAMYEMAKRLYPLCRSLTGPGVRDSLDILREVAPGLEIQEVPSGTECFDWTIPPEWRVHEAYLLDPEGNEVLNFKSHNLHLLGYSDSFDGVVDFEELQEHLYSIPDIPQAIPYKTSYFKRIWGFCLTHEQRRKLKPGRYRVKIETEFDDQGSMTMADWVLPGQESKEVMLSSYLCHPSMANNELSGPLVAVNLMRWLSELPDRRYTYRLFLGPETLGPIAYLDRHFGELKKNLIAGFNFTCCGDERTWSLMQSPDENTLADRVARHVLQHVAPDYKPYSFLERGSDECQYCSPNVRLPFVSIMRSKYGEYPEYHTSLDDLSLISAKGLGDTLDTCKKAITCVEENRPMYSQMVCEPFFSKRNLRPTLGAPRKLDSHALTISHLVAYSDGRELLAIAEHLGVPLWELLDMVRELRGKGLIADTSPKLDHPATTDD